MKRFILLIVLLSIYLNNCTDSISVFNEVEKEIIDTIFNDTSDIIEVEKEAIFLNNYDSLFFSSNNLFELKSYAKYGKQNYQLKKQDRYNVIISYQISDTILYLVMFLYQDNTIDVLVDDFSETDFFIISTKSITFKLNNNGILRMKIL